MFGGYARYSHRLPLDYFGYGDPSAATGRVYRWNDGNNDRLFQDGERGVLVAAVGPCCAGTILNRIDPDLQRPQTTEMFGAVEGRIGSWSLRVGALDRHERRLVASVNTGREGWRLLLAVSAGRR